MDLRIFEAKALAHALTESGHAVSERTVQRWKKGETQPKPQDIHAIRALVTTTKEAPPHWAEALANRVADRVIESLAPGPLSPNVTAALPRLIAVLEASQPPSTEGTPERSDTGDPVEQSQADPIAGSSHESEG